MAKPWPKRRDYLTKAGGLDGAISICGRGWRTMSERRHLNLAVLQ